MEKKVDVKQAHGELLVELFGRPTIDDPKVDLQQLEVEHTKYVDAMHKVQDKYGLKQGHPDFLEWIFTCVGPSPIIVADTAVTEVRGADDNESTTTAGE